MGGENAGCKVENRLSGSMFRSVKLIKRTWPESSWTKMVTWTEVTMADLGEEVKSTGTGNHQTWQSHEGAENRRMISGLQNWMGRWTVTTFPETRSTGGRPGLGDETGWCGGGFRYPASHAPSGCPREVNQAVELRYKAQGEEMCEFLLVWIFLSFLFIQVLCGFQTSKN